MGSTNAVLPKLGLGTAPLGGLYSPVDHDDGVATVLGAIAAGYRYLDTAPLYGYGRAERIVGDALRNTDAPISVSTKVGRVIDEEAPRRADDMFAGADGSFAWDFTASGVRRSLEGSLDRLGRDKVEVAFIHDPDDFVPQALDEAYPELEALRSEGLIDAIGVGMNEPSVPTQFVRDTDIDVVLIAGRYTLLDRSAGTELLPEARAKGVHVVAAGVYNSGILTGAESTPHFDYAPAPEGVIDRAKVLARLCTQFDCDLRTAAVQFPARHPAIGTVVIGARNVSEAEQNAHHLSADVPEPLWAVLENANVD